VAARLGTLHHKAKLTEDQVRAIRREYAEGGTSYWKLALAYDLESPSTIQKIIEGKAWKHV
jgi:hypothetical protein